MPGPPGRRPALRPQPVRHQAGLAARHLRPGSQPRPVLRHARHLDRVDALAGGGARDRPLQRRGHRPGRPRGPRLAPAGAGPPAHPRGHAPHHRRLVGPDRPGHRPGRGPAHRRDPRRPAGVDARAGRGGAGPGQDHLRDRRHARRRGRTAAPGVRDPGRGRHLPDRGLASRRPDHLGARSHHVVGRDQRGVAAGRPADPDHGRRVPRRGRPVRDQRRRGLRPRPARVWAPRSGTTAPGARCWA